MKNNKGFTLIEMLVSLVVLLILAGVALPMAEVGYTRVKEAELRASLRKIRLAIDAFHNDCMAGLIATGQTGVSRDCYPEFLSVLVEGVSSASADLAPYRYLRRIPTDPFASEEDTEKHWEIRGYRDELEGSWSGGDVYDVRVYNSYQAIDGSDYFEW